MDIDKSKISAFEDDLNFSSGKKENILVVISPKLKETASAAGYGERPIYYAEWNNIGIWNTMTIYIDSVEYVKVDPVKRERLLKTFISQEIANKMNVLGTVSIFDRL